MSYSESMGFAFILNPKTASKPMLKVGDDDDYTVTIKSFKNYIKAYFSDSKEETTQCIKESNKYLQEYSESESESEKSCTGDAIVNDCDGNPRVFWATVRKRSFPKLSQICQRLFNLIASSCASERVWSYYELIQTKRRNHLKPETMEKLTFIHLNQTMLDKDATQYFVPLLDYFDF